MYHERKKINGILHWRGKPNGDWIPFTQEQLTTIIEQKQQTIKRIDSMLESFEKMLGNMILK